jgi:DNA-binding XRE family transcriptional regulator
MAVVAVIGLFLNGIRINNGILTRLHEWCKITLSLRLGDNMDRKQFIELCDSKLKLVRTEFSFSQEKMAVILGISKKTLVEIEKGRSSLGWTGSVALCSIFYNGEVITRAFGGNPADIFLEIAFTGCEPHYEQTMGGKIWWHVVMENDAYIIQKNYISQHYRLLTRDGRRVASSLNLEDLTVLFTEK